MAGSVRNEQPLEYTDVVDLLFPFDGMQSVVWSHKLTLDPGRCQNFSSVAKELGMFLQKGLGWGMWIGCKPSGCLGGDGESDPIAAGQESLPRRNNARRACHRIKIKLSGGVELLQMGRSHCFGEGRLFPWSALVYVWQLGLGRGH